MSKPYAKSILSIFFVTILLLFFTACSQDQDQVQVQDVDPITSNEFNLTEKIEFEGVSVDLDPEWSVDTADKTSLCVDIDSYGQLDISTYKGSQTSSIESMWDKIFTSRNDDAPHTISVWDKESIHFETSSLQSEYDDSKFDSHTWFMTGYASESNKGFLLKLSFKDALLPYENQKDLFEALISTVTFNPSDLKNSSEELSRSNAEAKRDKSSSNSSNSTSTVSVFDPATEYSQGDIVKLDGFSLGGELTQDQTTGKKGTIIFFSMDPNASVEDAQCVVLLDTVRGINKGMPISLTGVCAVIDEYEVPVFVEL